MLESMLITDYRYSFCSSDFEIQGSEVGLGSQGYCRKKTLRGGRQDGVEIIEISNGVIAIRVCPTRGMGIIDGTFGAHRLGWDSPVQEVVHPMYINLLEYGGRGCHYGFNEFFNRCGIEWSGAMGEDETIDNMGNRNTVFLPLHGKVGWTPASRVELGSGGGSVWLRGEIREQMVFGCNYLLTATIQLKAQEPEILIHDTLHNLGDNTGEYEMLYHTNFGPPFLEEGASFLATYDALVPRDRFAAQGLAGFDRYPAPDSSHIEEVFLLRGAGDEEGYAHSLLINRSETLAARVSYAVQTLPYSILWKRCSGLKEGYVTGLNPCSDLPNPRKSEREQGRLGKIEPGQSIDFHERIRMYEGREEVRGVREQVRKCRGQEQRFPAGDFEGFASRAHN
jgi:hypothetical protein